MFKRILPIIATIIVTIIAPLTATSSLGMTNDGLLNLDLKVYIAARPISLILVEKNSLAIKVLRHDGRLQVSHEYRVALGENFGPKKKEGDEKTPEGIYFITKKYIDNKITVFGTKAFHLNYPNIFDTLDGRDGNGIYIHGTNKPLRYNSTNGCVALNDHDLSSLANFLKVGKMPVVIVPSLLGLKTSPAKLPNLTGHNFALAKKLLMPEGISPKVKFNSLYLLRVNDQTVVAGEYGENETSSSFAASYIKFYPKKGWAVVERVPHFLSEDTPPKKLAAQNYQIFLQKDAGTNPIYKTGKKAGEDRPSLWSWPPREKDVYLSWYRKSLQQRQVVIPPQPKFKGKETIEIPSKPVQTNNFIYSLLLLCFLLAVTLFFTVTRLRRIKKTAVGTLKNNGQQIIIDNTICQRQTDNLQSDINILENAIKTLHTYLEETRLMDKQELQARIDGLESNLQAKQAEIEQLITEKSALKLRSMSHLSVQVEELGVMRQDLQDSQKKLDESRQDLERLPMLEQMLAAEQEKVQQLAIKNATLKNGNSSESTTLKAEIANFTEELSILKEKLRISEAEKETLDNKVAEGLTSGLHEDEMRRMITDEQHKSSLLSEKLAGFSTIEATLKEELAISRRQNNELSERIENLARSHGELSKTEEERTTNSLALQKELDMAHQEISLLTAQNSSATATLCERNSDLEDLLLARQVEVTRLTNDMHLREHATEQHKADIAALRSQLEGVHEDLMAESEKRQEAQQQLTEILATRKREAEHQQAELIAAERLEVEKQQQLAETMAAKEQEIKKVDLHEFSEETAETEDAPPAAEPITTEASVSPAPPTEHTDAPPKQKSAAKISERSALLPQDILDKWLSN